MEGEEKQKGEVVLQREGEVVSSMDEDLMEI